MYTAVRYIKQCIHYLKKVRNSIYCNCMLMCRTIPHWLWRVLEAATQCLVTIRRGVLSLSMQLYDPLMVDKAPLWISLRADNTWGRMAWCVQNGHREAISHNAPIPLAPWCRSVLCEPKCLRHIAVTMGWSRYDKYKRQTLFASLPWEKNVWLIDIVWA